MKTKTLARELKGVDGRRWGVLRRFDIPDVSNPERTYLRRWRIIETPWFGIKVHHILLPDGDRALHDHPWTFVSIILRGGYTEQVPWLRPSGAPQMRRWPSGRPKYRVVRYRPGSWHRMPSEGLHRITELHGSCWTLVINGPRQREWGFVNEDGDWEPWHSYVKRNYPQMEATS